MIVGNAVYVDGRRAEEPGSLQETYEAVRQRRGVACIALYKPTELLARVKQVGSSIEDLHPFSFQHF